MTVIRSQNVTVILFVFIYFPFYKKSVIQHNAKCLLDTPFSVLLHSSDYDKIREIYFIREEHYGSRKPA